MSVVGAKGRASVQINTGNTAVRKSPRDNFGSHMRSGIAIGAGAAAQAVGVAAPMIPGGAVLSAAMSQGAQSMAGGGLGGGGNSAMVGATGSSGAGGGVMGGSGNFAGQAAAGSKSSTDSLMDQTKAMQEMGASFNLQYLNLQQKMQSENRSFTSISNVLKTKHDTSKGAIANVR